ncbi:MAG: hypothetical protein SR1Q7_12480 [Quinella sp. 1Q7]|nr:hypothetical protein [Quinella sp. 1Q7]
MRVKIRGAGVISCQSKISCGDVHATAAENFPAAMFTRRQLKIFLRRCSRGGG